MEILAVTYEEYERLIPHPYQAFGSAAFNKANEDKCEKVHYLLFKDGKYRLGLIVGQREKELKSPFSAPFGGFSFLQPDIKLGYLDTALEVLQQWALQNSLQQVRLTLPPAIYHNTFIAKQINALFRAGYRIDQTDLNYQFVLQQFNLEQYPETIWYNAKKNFRIAMQQHLQFVHCNNEMEKKLAYDVIQQNREARGFPLRMSWQQVQLSASMMPADFFLVKDDNATAVAAAIVFQVASQIVQVIYWGDLPAYSALKTMNFLSCQVFNHYHQKGMAIVDIGPSTENSVPNHGLCEFKESIGCTISPKHSFCKSLG
jgi:hypothetical protein